MKMPRYLKVRLTDEGYLALRQEADSCGCTISDLARRLITNGAHSQAMQQALEQITARLAEPVVVTVPVLPDEIERTLIETLLLVRELAGERNPQLIARVAQLLRGRVKS
jgi:negative regulator of replication initiation